MIKENDNIMYNYQTIMMIHNRNTHNKEERLERAFRYHNKEDIYIKECLDIFNNYLLGGVEILYEKIFGEGKELDDYIVNLYDFLEEFHIRYKAVEQDVL